MPTTLKEDADIFIKGVLRSKDKILTMYQNVWPCMCNEEWREYVLEALKLTHVEFSKMYFSAPDELDGWTFTAYVKHGETPMSKRKLHDIAY